MKKIIIIFFSILIFSCIEPIQKEEDKKDYKVRFNGKVTPTHIAIFGDSRIEQFNEYMINFTCYNFGVNGNTAGKVLKQWREAINDGYNLDGFIIIIFVGRNDAYFNYNVQDYIKNVKDFLKTFNTTNKIYFISCIPDSEVVNCWERKNS